MSKFKHFLVQPNVGPFLQTDGRRLQQILYNLLGNAIKFSTPGRSIELSLELCNEAKVVDTGADFFSPTNKNSTGRGPVRSFSIKNYGKGIPRKDFKKIFKPFRQSSGSGAHEGTGLGLAITTRLVHALGGCINVEREYEEWAKFTAEFPADSVEPVDVQSLSLKMKNTAAALICNDEGVSEQLKGLFGDFSTGLRSFESLGALKQQLISEQNGISKEGRVICLVDENLYNKNAIEVLEKSAKQIKLSVTTFGPKHIISDTQNHFRSLVRLLPSVLIEHLASLDTSREAAAPPKRDSNTRTSLDGVGDADRLTYQNYRVLVAEDNVINQKVLVRMLRRIGLEEIDVVDNGQKAVDLEASTPFDVVLMDMQMPVMDGVEACKLILGRKLGSHPRAKVFFVTAHAASEFESICRRAGGSGFLPKPMHIGDVEQCFQKLHALIEEESSSSEGASSES